jgi:hypothetical protein
MPSPPWQERLGGSIEIETPENPSTLLKLWRKYQSPDGKQGFEFLADNNVILHEVDKNQQLAGKYEILKGEDAQKLKISGPAGSSVIDIELKGDSLILKQGQENLVFRKVDRFAVPTP